MRSAAALMLILLVILIGVLFDWNWLRSPLAGYVSDKLGRNFAIHGDLHVELSPLVLVQADDVVLDNASWADAEPLAQASRIALRIDARELFSRRFVLSDILLVRPRLSLERSAQGEANWEFPALPVGTGPPPAIGSLTIEAGVVRYRDPAVDTDVMLSVASASADSDAPAIRFAGEGRLRKQPFAVVGRGAPLLSLRDTTKPYRLEVQASAGDTRASFAGSFVPLQLRDIDGELKLRGADLSKLYPIIPLPLPWTPPYQLSGHLLHDNAKWTFREFSGRVGSSDLNGELTLDKSRQRPLIVAAVTSHRLNYKDLGGFVGIPPGSQPQLTNTPQQKQAADQRAASGKVLSDKPYDLERLRAVDARVRFTGVRIIAADLPFDNLSADLDLEQGELKLQPLKFGIAGGSVVSNIRLDARQQAIKTTAQVSARNLDLARIVPQLKPPKGEAGTFSGRAQLSSSGNSVAQILASMDGEIAMIMSGGQASTLTLFLTNLDLAHAAQLLLRGDDNSAIRCVVTDFTAKQGVMVANNLVADTSAVSIQGEGSVNMREERYDLVLKAKSKQASPLALRGPIVVKGSFKHPQVRPATGPVAARAGAAVALGVLATPLAAIAPLIDLGGGKDSDCQALIADVERAGVNAREQQRRR